MMYKGNGRMIMSERHAYRTNVQWSTKRKGKLSTFGMPTIEVATPPEFPSGHPDIWSPEHLFVGAAEVCLMTTFLAIAEKSKLQFVNYVSEAEGTLEKTESGFQVTTIVIRPKVTVTVAEDLQRAVKLLHKAEAHCLISNSMKTTVSIEPEAVLAQLP